MMRIYLISLAWFPGNLLLEIALFSLMVGTVMFLRLVNFDRFDSWTTFYFIPFDRLVPNLLLLWPIYCIWMLYFKKPKRNNCNLLYGAAESVVNLRCSSAISALLKVTKIKVASLEYVSFLGNLWKLHQWGEFQKKSGGRGNRRTPPQVPKSVAPVLRKSDSPLLVVPIPETRIWKNLI